MTQPAVKPASLSPALRRVLLLACGLACGISGIAAVSHAPASARTTQLQTSTVPPVPTFPLAAILKSSTVGTSVAEPEAVPASFAQVSLDLLQDFVVPKPVAPKSLAPTVAPPTTIDDDAPKKGVERAPAYRVIMMEVTAYCPCTKCCGENAQGITASGKRVTHNAGRFVAADTRILPFNTQLSIPGYHGGQPVPVLDRGGAIKGNKLDVYFDSHETAKQWGRRMIPVRVLAGE